ncbi:MAG: endonuclease, partial [Muribaculaceae bacterium]|nr:endonuclease [Muribaculaceae bacterium]
MKLSTLFFAALACSSAYTAVAEVPRGYYTSLTGKKEAALKDAIHTLTYNHTLISSYSDLPQYFRYTDVYPKSNDRYGQWWDMYSDIPLPSNSFWGLNREHAFPKSWWGGATNIPAYTDLNHLYPSEQAANTAKSNYPLGLVQTSTFDNGVTKVGYAQTGYGFGAAQVFEPDDEYKGDFARTYFYMVCCYQNLTWKYTYMV